MKILLIFIGVLLLLGGFSACYKKHMYETNEVSITPSVSVFLFEGHKYLTRQGSIVHAESCICKNKLGTINF